MTARSNVRSAVDCSINNGKYWIQQFEKLDLLFDHHFDYV